MKTLYLLLLSVCLGFGATITGPVSDITGSTSNKRVEFWPQSTPFFSGTNLVIGGEPKVVQVRSNQFSVVLSEGRYLLKFPPSKETATIWVPNTTNTYTLYDIQTNSFVVLSRSDVASLGTSATNVTIQAGDSSVTIVTNGPADWTITSSGGSSAFTAADTVVSNGLSARLLATNTALAQAIVAATNGITGGTGISVAAGTNIVLLTNANLVTIHGTATGSGGLTEAQVVASTLTNTARSLISGARTTNNTFIGHVQFDPVNISSSIVWNPKDLSGNEITRYANAIDLQQARTDVYRTATTGNYIFGGAQNVCDSTLGSAVIIGGSGNTNQGNDSVVVTGGGNFIDAIDGFIGAGIMNVNSSSSGAIVAGERNYISAVGAFIGAGRDNILSNATAVSHGSSILAGISNTNTHLAAHVIGSLVSSSADYSVDLGYHTNKASVYSNGNLVVRGSLLVSNGILASAVQAGAILTNAATIGSLTLQNSVGVAIDDSGVNNIYGDGTDIYIDALFGKVQFGSDVLFNAGMIGDGSGLTNISAGDSLGLTNTQAAATVPVATSASSAEWRATTGTGGVVLSNAPTLNNPIVKGTMTGDGTYSTPLLGGLQVNTGGGASFYINPFTSYVGLKSSAIVIWGSSTAPNNNNGDVGLGRLKAGWLHLNGGTETAIGAGSLALSQLSSTNGITSVNGGITNLSSAPLVSSNILSSGTLTVSNVVASGTISADTFNVSTINGTNVFLPSKTVAPALGFQGAAMFSDGTNIVFVIRNAGGVITTNKLTSASFEAWP